MYSIIDDLGTSLPCFSGDAYRKIYILKQKSLDHSFQASISFS